MLILSCQWNIGNSSFSSQEDLVISFIEVSIV